MKKHWKKYGWLYILLSITLSLLIVYWIIIGFNPFAWVSNHLTGTINFIVLVAIALIIVFAFWLHKRK